MAQPASISISQRFTDFSLNLRYEDLPAEVIVAAKHALFEVIGAALLGSQEISTRIVLDALVDSDKSGDASVLGTCVSTMPIVAAFVNAHAAHTPDYDDFSHEVGTQMSAAVVPAATLVL